MGAAGVIVTRDEDEEGRLTALLEARGLRVIHWPTIRVAPPADPEPLERALGELRDYAWIVFTSPRAARAVTGRGAELPGAERPRVAAVGTATADALQAAGWPVDLVPVSQTGTALVEALRDADVAPGSWVLFPASAIARDTVPDGLEEAGLVVVQVEAYRTLPAELDGAACRAALEDGSLELVTFTSPSTVRNLERALGPELAERARGALRAVAIGPTTAAEAEAYGWDTAVAEPHSLEGLAERVAAVAGRDRIEEE